MRVAVVGVGLIGGSLALALKQRPDVVVIGCDSNPASLRTALARGAVDEVTDRLEEAVCESDVVFLSAPVSELYALVDRLAELPLPPGAIVTDTGSTKAGIVRAARKLAARGVTFIGGHPMAGSHKSGVEAARADLFENAYYVLTPEEDTPAGAVAALSDLLAATRAKVVTMDPMAHDRVVGAISHLPHVVAAALVNLVADLGAEDAWYERLAAGGFRDLTRIASSNPALWRDIVLDNRSVLLDHLRRWQDALAAVVAHVEAGDAAAIERFFRAARTFRDRLPERRPGALPAVHELFVDVPDRPGVIGRVATLLGESGINLVNIEVLEIREDIFGVLRLVFQREADRVRARALLEGAGYAVHEREALAHAGKGER